MPVEVAVDDRIHFRILEDIARDLSGDVNFPICMDAAILVRNTLKDPSVSLERVSQVIGTEPLIASKLLRLANSVAYNPSGKLLTDIRAAIARLGFQAVRTTSLAVAMDQMLKSRNLSDYDDIARAAWEHSVQVAAIARVLARHLGRVNADDAMLAGLVHDIGVFYLLYRAAEYPEYRQNRPAMVALLSGWHESIGESLLHILGVPDTVVDAIHDHDQLAGVESPCSVRDVLYFANLLAGHPQEWLAVDEGEGAGEDTAAREADRQRYADIVAEAEDDIRELRGALVRH